MQYQITSMKGELKNEIQTTIKNQQTALMSQNNAFQNTLQNNLQTMLSSFFQAQASPSGTLPSNTIPNPKGEMKAITTRSGVAYEDSRKPLEPPRKIVNFKADPRVPLILGRSFLKAGRTLIDVYEGEITLYVDNEAVTFNLEQTMKYSSTNDKLLSTSEPFYFQFTLEEIDAFLYDKSFSLESDHDDCDPEEDIYVLEQLLNDDPFQLPARDLKQSEVTKAKPLIEEPPELELKDLPSHLEYAFLEENNKLPFIIAKGYFQIPIDPHDQEKMTFTCPYGTFAYRRMPFGLCNAPGTFQRCMMAIFHDMIEKTMEVFMDDFSVFGDSFDSCLSNLERMLKRCEDTNLVLNWEKCHFMCKEGIVLGHKISKSGIEVDRAKVDVIAKLPHPTTVKGVRSFLGHAGFYRRFIQDFSKISRPITHLLKKDTPFVFSQDCINAFETLKKKLTEAAGY
ncbi:reverse transcriptase domain-containing protein [Tanacetum coccineum]|uniref:Reverse transcriptase domain-containing protein n=1 Tax=Tanacetum coccineum TaxID=301880 RepID=A0ABQ5I8C5_9ASTR